MCGLRGGGGVGRISLDSNVILTSDLEYKLQNKNDPEYDLRKYVNQDNAYE